ncbi:MAG: PorV/PorQ family protein [Imperialibacter sp.]|uniref:putative type IX sorting system protein PorV2 n=1 Tax=Imperialibacter sp. TaxID=2038411 RepID=UPI0032EAA9AD
MRIALLFTLCLFCSGLVVGQGNAPKYSNEFLAIGVGARALGMGNTQVGLANDVTAGYWNPAALTQLTEQYQVGLMHAAYFAGIANYDFAGFATPIDSNTFMGVSVIRFGVDNIPDTRFLYDASGAINYDNIRFFSAADYAFMFSLAKKMGGLSLGGNLKVIHRTVGDFANAWGFGLDVALQYNRGNWKMGAVLRDATGTFNAWTHNSSLVIDVYTQTGNVIPESSLEITLPRLSLGLANAVVNRGKWTGLVGADVDLTFDGQRNTLIKSKLASIDPKAGFEVSYAQKAFLRGGVSQLQQVKDFDGSKSWTYLPSFGIGLNLQGVQIDYALTDIGNRAQSPYSHIFSLRYGWNAK